MILTSSKYKIVIREIWIFNKNRFHKKWSTHFTVHSIEQYPIRFPLVAGTSVNGLAKEYGIHKELIRAVPEGAKVGIINH